MIHATATQLFETHISCRPEGDRPSTRLQHTSTFRLFRPERYPQRSGLSPSLGAKFPFKYGTKICPFQYDSVNICWADCGSEKRDSTKWTRSQIGLLKFVDREHRGVAQTYRLRRLLRKSNRWKQKKSRFFTWKCSNRTTGLFPHHATVYR